jgi:hypothetical protein
MLIEQYGQFKDILVKQLCMASAAGTSGNDVVDRMEDHHRQIAQSVSFAVTGNKVLNREEIIELSQPGGEVVMKVSIWIIHSSRKLLSSKVVNTGN